VDQAREKGWVKLAGSDRDLVFRSALTTQRGWLDWKDRYTGDVIELAENLLSEIREELR
jgi:hypothetical protein